jgi:hypothetical protein
LKPLSEQFAGYASTFTNDMHNAMPASGATIDHTPYEGLLGRQVTLGTLLCFCCQCWVHTPGTGLRTATNSICMPVWDNF